MTLRKRGGDARRSSCRGRTRGWLRNRDARIPVSHTPAAIRARLEQLPGEGILELEHGGAYRASEIALYSSYHLPSPPPIPALTNE